MLCFYNFIVILLLLRQQFLYSLSNCNLYNTLQLLSHSQHVSCFTDAAVHFFGLIVTVP
jgi:hypothetical protein